MAAVQQIIRIARIPVNIKNGHICVHRIGTLAQQRPFDTNSLETKSKGRRGAKATEKKENEEGDELNGQMAM
jgi:hypothetical protein